MTDLMPPSAIQESRQRAAVMARLSEIPVPVRHMWNPQTIPAPFLPYLAWSFSVDYWNPDWDDATKRRVIAASWDTHAYKGTIYAIEEAVKTLGYAIEIEEWFQNEQLRRRGTFGVRVQVTPDTPSLTTTRLRDIEAAITRAKRASQHHDIRADVGFTADTGVICAGVMWGAQNQTGQASGRQHLQHNQHRVVAAQLDALNAKSGTLSGRCTLVQRIHTTAAATFMINLQGQIS
ncbi:MAG: phage tail protein I [Marinobacterium sp.]|nr:phage tail protein I [Marinobacterium sp.]